MSEPKFKALEKSTAELISACQRGIEAAREINNSRKGRLTFIIDTANVKKSTKGK